MIIITTPMCEKILDLAGISQYKVNKNPDNEAGDLAILLSENKTEMNSLNIKLNTFSQIKDSIIEVSKIGDNGNISKSPISEGKIKDIFAQYSIAIDWIFDERKDLREKNSKIKVKVYSKFLKDIVEDMGFSIIDFNDEVSDFDYIVLPDYMNIKDLANNCNYNDYNIISIPTHKNVPKDPIKRAELRYSILNNLKV